MTEFKKCRECNYVIETNVEFSCLLAPIGDFCKVRNNLTYGNCEDFKLYKTPEPPKE